MSIVTFNPDQAPGPRDLAVIGANPMNHSRAEEAFETSFRTSAADLGSTHRPAA